MGFSSTQDLIEEIRAGRQIILMDDEDRENEGDLVMAAEHITAADINFMAKYGRGLICLSLTPDYIQELDLPLMAGTNSSRYETNFTISIEASSGVTTGISAADRAHTIQTAIHSDYKKGDIVSPGHIFPLAAKAGGVLTRTGHTEASVDFARLAGKKGAAVICEIMKDDGTMARRDDLLVFGKDHNLKIGTISGLVNYRIQHDNLVTLKKSHPIVTDYAGEFTCHIYENTLDGSEYIALTKGKITSDSDIYVRMHSVNSFTDILDVPPKNSNSIQKALQKIDQKGTGVCVLLRDYRPNALSNALEDLLELSNKNAKKEFRSFGIGAQILLNVGVRKMIILSNASQDMSMPALEGYGLTFVRKEGF